MSETLKQKMYLSGILILLFLSKLIKNTSDTTTLRLNLV